MTPSLTDFLLARLAEDEAAAQILADGYPDFPGASYMAANLDLIEVTTGYARVLREVEAKRRIVEVHHPDDPCDAHDSSFQTIDCDTLRLLALPYADHPDYQGSWKP